MKLFGAFLELGKVSIEVLFGGGGVGLALLQLLEILFLKISDLFFLSFELLIFLLSSLLHLIDLHLSLLVLRSELLQSILEFLH